MLYKDYKILRLEWKKFKELDINEEIFTTLKTDYEDFGNWFVKKQEGDEKAMVYIDQSKGTIEGFLYLKVEDQNENYSNINPEFSERKRLKIGTFKVTKNGFKMGERFLKIAFDHAELNQVEEIYVTIFNDSKEKEKLINLLKDFGFKYWGRKDGEEEVYVKPFYYQENIKNPKHNFPFVNIEKVNFFILPINPEYHTNLLPDAILNTESPETYKNDWPWLYAIQKNYIGDNLWEENWKEGDIVLFYRTAPDKEKPAGFQTVVTSIGVIFDIKNFKDCEDKKKILRRAILKEEDLSKFNNPKVLEFLFLKELSKRITLKILIDLGIIEVGKYPRGLTKISKENFEKILFISKTQILSYNIKEIAWKNQS